MGNLESQVEDMKELLAMKRSKERKLDAELLELQESMHKTSREKRRLSIEKEQLAMDDIQSQSFLGETQHSSRQVFFFFHFNLSGPPFQCCMFLGITEPIISDHHRLTILSHCLSHCSPKHWTSPHIPKTPPPLCWT